MRRFSDNRVMVSFDAETLGIVRELANGRATSAASVVRSLCASSLRQMGFEIGPVIEVPAWVPDALQERYRQIAYRDGEEAAAAFARAQKALAA